MTLPLGCINTGEGSRLIVVCSNAGFTTIPNVCDGCTEKLIMAHNELKEITPKAFQKCYNLLVLDLRYNVIRKINTDAFYGLRRLENLYLQVNDLDGSSFDGNVFRPLISLLHLDLTGNHFHRTGQYPTFEFTYLDFLGLDAFNGYLERLCPWPLPVRSLLLNFEHDIFFECDFNAFDLDILTELEIRIKDNNDSFDSRAILSENVFQHFRNLSRLSLRVSSQEQLNNFTSLFRGFRMKTISRIFLRFTRKDAVVYLIREAIEALAGVCVHHVSLDSVSFDHFSCKPLNMSVLASCLQTISLQNVAVLDRYHLTRPFNCLLWLDKLEVIKMNDMCSTQKATSTLDFGNVSLPIPKNVRWLEMRNTFDCNASQPKIDVLSIYGENLKYLDLSRKKLFTINRVNFTALNNLTELNIEGWRFKCDDYLWRFSVYNPFLRRLRYTDPHMATFFSKPENPILARMTHLISLDASESFGNNLSIPSYIHDKYVFPSGLQFLSLSKNRLTTIPKGLLHLGRLSYLDLSDNFISSIFLEFRLRFSELSLQLKVDVSKNPLDCSCENLDFLIWFKKTFPMISPDEKRKETKCYARPNEESSGIEGVLQELNQLQESCQIRLRILIPSFLIILLLLISMVVVFIYKNHLYMAWWRSCLRKWKYKTLLDDDKEFDVFIAYADDESHWVNTYLVPILSHEGVTVCTHEKDFIPGVFIIDNIFHFFEKSRRILFIISRTFLDSKWGQREMEIARYHAIGKKCSKEIFVVMKKDIKPHEMPDVLKNVWFNITCIKCPKIDDEKSLTNFKKKLLKALKPKSDNNSRSEHIV